MEIYPFLNQQRYLLRDGLAYNHKHLRLVRQHVFVGISIVLAIPSKLKQMWVRLPLGYLMVCFKFWFEYTGVISPVVSLSQVQIFKT